MHLLHQHLYERKVKTVDRPTRQDIQRINVFEGRVDWQAQYPHLWQHPEEVIVVDGASAGQGSFSDFWELAEQLRKAGRLDEAEALLLKLDAAARRESRRERWGYTAPAYAFALARMYRKQQRFADEAQVLQQFLDSLSPKFRSADFGTTEQLDKARRCVEAQRGVVASPTSFLRALPPEKRFVLEEFPCCRATDTHPRARLSRDADVHRPCPRCGSVWHVVVEPRSASSSAGARAGWQEWMITWTRDADTL
jgi:hypothetical protein